jgi:hypothetical protein
MAINQLIAFLLMTIDHSDFMWSIEIGFACKMIGRLALPLFIYGIVQGVKNTKDLNKYLIRLFLLAFLSEPVFYLLFHRPVNIIFVLIYCALICVLTEKNLIFGLAVNCLFFWLPGYWFFVGLMAIGFYAFEGWRQWIIVSWALFWWAIDPNSLMIFQPIGVFALVVIEICKGRIYLKKIHRRLKYLYYPVHMVLFVVIRSLL